MSLLTTMQQDISVIETDLGNKTFTWNGEDYACSPASLSSEVDLGIGGFMEKVDKLLVVRKNVFTDGIYPVSKEFLTFNTKHYRILQVVSNANDAFLKLFLVNDSVTS